MSSTIDDIIKRANYSLQNQQGFRGCRLHTDQYVLAYDFATGQDAELFKLQRLSIAESMGLKYEIRDDQPNIVLEYRPSVS
jgi:hypothetical protein